MSRAKRERTVTVALTPAEPLPEIHIAQDTLTFLWFPSLILKKTLSVDASRIRVLDVGERSIVVQAAEDGRAGERHELAVVFADGKAPARAAFVLVMDPAVVDTRIDIVRPEPPGANCPVEAQSVAMSAADVITSGLIDNEGVLTQRVENFIDAASGFRSRTGASYRAKTWVLVDVEFFPPPQYPAWRPSSATLTSPRGAVQVRTMKLEPSKDGPEGVRVLVETEVPPPSLGPEFALHLTGPDGAPSFSIPHVKLSPAKESQP